MPDILSSWIVSTNRYNIPLIFKYMRGLVDLKKVRVYVNFNEYPIQNVIKSKVFETVCTNKGCLYLWIPIRDDTCPTSEQLIFWIELCKKCRQHSRRMIYHCGMGLGRTAYMTFCNLLCMEYDINPNYVLDYIQGLKNSVQEKYFPEGKNTWYQLEIEMELKKEPAPVQVG